MNACFGEMLERDSGATQKVYNMARESKKDKTPTGTVESPICNQGRGALAPISVYHSCILPAHALDMISAIMLLSGS